MNIGTRYRVNEPAVVHELFEDEVIIVNMESGNYYSTRHVGAAIWAAIAGGASIDETVAAVAASYAGAGDEIAVAVAAFIGDLERENLILADPSRLRKENGNRPAPANGARPPFVAPVIETHRDMQDLLLLDPIHDVDLAGWPVLKPEATAERK